MRLDLLLKATCITKRRAFAKRLCDEGCVKVNNRAAKAGRIVQPGDEIEVRTRQHVMRFKLLDIPHKSSTKEEAGQCYELLEEFDDVAVDTSKDDNSPGVVNEMS